MTYSASLIWMSIAICVAQCAVFSGLNLAIFSVSKLRLEVVRAPARKGTDSTDLKVTCILMGLGALSGRRRFFVWHYGNYRLR